ncbi:peptide ABC transporter ATP-binding protein [Flexivirga endophytica]|uniref:Peptide ABC transporter ATP-binding protein n=1 Tax=Flexivirga endophytica TaxID=1849103 RepID=A0A916T5C1_9MICO|nr:dipeptide/oligopeptide/nickel ABC transporter permease/ATP-binding protein [Flexivirga endophytica]GGB29003.1 peptide ABC transporter ATP-binding protein [Flexivirga endophytica]GHB50044.1 peptide ABC transporter ATP-binding protein [Flexivirga endophytica]
MAANLVTELESTSGRRGNRSRWVTVVRTPVGAAAVIALGALLVLAVVAPILWSGQATRADTAQMLHGPSGDHWAGTDNLGRDILARVLVATRLSVELALLATLIMVVSGLLLGTLGVLFGRRVGRVTAAVINVAVAFPGLLLALFFAVIFGIGTKGAVLAIGLAGAPSFARLVQTLVSGVEQRDFVLAARVAGVNRFRILLRHVLPNVGEALIVNATIGAGSALLSFAGLSFLGLGVQPPDYDWGQLLGNGLTGIFEHPVAALAPGIAVVLAGLAFNFFGEAVAKAIGVTTTIGRIRVRVPKPAVAPDRSEADRPDGDTVLQVTDLRVSFPAAGGVVTPVRGVSFGMARGETVGVVGESGSGKSLTALAIAQLIERPAAVEAGRLEFLGTDLRGGGTAHRDLLGVHFSMVFQDPMTSMNPTHRVGGQLAEVARRHGGLSRKDANDRAVDRLDAVQIPDPRRRAHQYPHEFSGGMRQRAMIGMGLMGDPALIVADEPTTALDVTVQSRVLHLLEEIRREQNVALLLISHDISVVRQVCDRVLVMYAGQIVEDLPAADLHSAARHPYTRALIAVVPDMHTALNQPLAVIPGRAPDPTSYPAGCAFAPRCPLATAQCRTEAPPLETDAAGRRVACWNAEAPIEVIPESAEVLCE